MALSGKTVFLIAVHIWCCILLFISKKCKATGPKAKFPAILVFGDSIVDTGNNNYLKTLIKGNHFPYGQDFPGHVATGRFSNGKLIPDFVASMLNIKEIVPPFLDPNLSDNDLVTGGNFASSGSGFDNVTGAAFGIISFSKQEHYELGCRRLAISGLLPLGCLPVQMTLKFECPLERRCIVEENLDALVYNEKLTKLLPKIQSLLPESKIVYADQYKPLTDMINNPQKFGFTETKRGCCGTGLVETGPFCNALTAVCDNVLEHWFWDAAQPSQIAPGDCISYPRLNQFLRNYGYSHFREEEEEAF